MISSVNLFQSIDAAQLLSLPLWVTIAVALLLISAIIIALLTGREIQFWPPKIGQSIDKTLLEEKNKDLNDKLAEARIEVTRLKEKLEVIMQPLSKEKTIGDLLTLFDRQAMRTSLFVEDYEKMYSSLRDLRIGLQQGGVSTVKNPLLRELLKKIIGDIEWIEGTKASYRLLDLKDAGEVIRVAFPLDYILNINNIPYALTDEEFEKIKEFMNHTLSRTWSDSRTKKLTREQISNACTVLWFFSATETKRRNILSEVELMRMFLTEEFS
jgi:hypothetical protein